MGSTSEEPTKAVKKGKKLEWPVNGVDYHQVKVLKGEFVPPVYLQKSFHRLPKADVAYYLTHLKNGTFKLEFEMRQEHRTKMWYLVPGPKPNPKWGPVCP